MGGCAFTIPILEPPDPPAGRIWERWFRPRPRDWQVSETKTQILRVRPAPELARLLAAEWRAWLGNRLAQPSPSSSVVLQYLADVSPQISLRGLGRKSDPDFSHWIQISFSGCAGMAESSASVAAHWADCWFREEHETIAQRILRPNGFVWRPPASDEENTFPLFMPLDSLGYIACDLPDDSGAPVACAVDEGQSMAFEGDARLGRLESLAATMIADRRCRCQLCQP